MHAFSFLGYTTKNQKLLESFVELFKLTTKQKKFNGEVKDFQLTKRLYTI